MEIKDLLRNVIKEMVESRIRETDITDGSRVPVGSQEHITDLEMRIADLERWRDRQRRGSEDRANYARLISRLRSQLRSALRIANPVAMDDGLGELDGGMKMGEADGDKKDKKRRVKCANCSKIGYVSRAWTDSSEPYMCAKCDDAQVFKQNAPVTEAVSMKDPEYSSIETFVQFLLDDERDSYTHEELTALNFRTRMPVNTIRKELEGYGLTLANRPNEKKVRGFSSNSNDRWFGPGSMATHGGAGIDPQTGRATSGRGDI